MNLRAPTPPGRIRTPRGSVDPSRNLRPRGEPSLARREASNQDRKPSHTA